MEVISGLIEQRYPDVGCSYLIADPETSLITKNREELVIYVKKLYISLFRKEPEQNFWCPGYNIAYAGPIPEKRP